MTSKISAKGIDFTTKHCFLEPSGKIVLPQQTFVFLYDCFLRDWKCGHFVAANSYFSDATISQNKRFIDFRAPATERTLISPNVSFKRTLSYLPFS